MDYFGRNPSFLKLMPQTIPTEVEVPKIYVSRHYSTPQWIDAIDITASGGFRKTLAVRWNEGSLFLTKGWSEVVAHFKIKAGDAIQFVNYEYREFDIVHYLVESELCDSCTDIESGRSYIKLMSNLHEDEMELPKHMLKCSYSEGICQIMLKVTNMGGKEVMIGLHCQGENSVVTNGFQKIITDYNLNFDDVLSFKVIDNNVLEMMVYSLDGCEREFCEKPVYTLSPNAEVIVLDDSESENNDGIEASDGNGEQYVDELMIEDDDGVVEENVNEEDDVNGENSVSDSEDVLVLEEEDDTDEIDDSDDEPVLVFELPEDGSDSEDDDEEDMEEFVLVSVIIPYGKTLRLKGDMLALPGLRPGRTVDVVNMDGVEYQWGLRRDYRRARYNLYVSSGWQRFVRENELNPMDEVTFIYHRDEAKFYMVDVE